MVDYYTAASDMCLNLDHDSEMNPCPECVNYTVGIEIDAAVESAHQIRDADVKAAAEREREQCAIEASHWYDGKAAAKAIRARSTTPPAATEGK